MLKNSSDFKQWKEEKISARLLHEMKNLDLLKSNQIIVDREHHLEDKDVLFGDKEASEEDRIDFIFLSSWFQKKYLEYFGEAKNISLNNWKKAIGSKVNASSYRKRYIETGINNLVFGKYSKLEGFLIAYVVNGTAKENRASLNEFIKEKNLLPKTGLLENALPICSYPSCYFSKNITVGKVVVLQHIFLEYDN